MTLQWSSDGKGETTVKDKSYAVWCGGWHATAVRNTRSNLKGSARNFNCSDEVNMAGSVRGPSLSRTAGENEQTLVSEAPETIMSSALARGLSCGLGRAFMTNFSIISTRWRITFVPVCSACFCMFFRQYGQALEEQKEHEDVGNNCAFGSIYYFSPFGHHRLWMHLSEFVLALMWLFLCQMLLG